MHKNSGENVGLPTAYSALDVYHDSETCHHVGGSHVVRQDETGACQEDIVQSTVTGIPMHNSRNKIMPNSCDRDNSEPLEAASQGAHLQTSKLGIGGLTARGENYNLAGNSLETQ